MRTSKKFVNRSDQIKALRQKVGLLEANKKQQDALDKLKKKERELQGSRLSPERRKMIIKTARKFIKTAR